MTYVELQEKVANYEATQQRKNNIESFARKFAAIFTVVGSLLVAYGVVVSFIIYPEDAQTISIPVVTAVWKFIVAFASEKGLPIYATISVAGLLSSLLAILATVLYGCLSKKISVVPQNKAETIENAAALRELFWQQIQNNSNSNSNMINILLYFIGALLIFITMGCQISNAFVGVVMGVFCSLLSYLVLYVFRGIFILSLRYWWKEDDALYSDIHFEFKLLIPRLEQEESERKEAQEQNKRKEREEQARKEQERQKQENLSKADALYKEMLESGSSDINKLAEIAALGHYDAALMLCKLCFNESNSDARTDEEQRMFLQMMSKTLTILDHYHNQSAETKLLQIVTAIRLCEYKNIDEYKSALRNLREIKQLDELPAEYAEVCDITIRCLVDTINKLDEVKSNTCQTIADDNDDWQPAKDELESVIWHDFRTGEQLYRNKRTGKIVNVAGEEVPSTWWE